MNKQQKSETSRGIEWCDYTWNPVGGCKHACRWEMPDGSTAKCYAETVAESIHRRNPAMYASGFTHHYWHPERLDEPLKVKAPSKIFLDSMSDLMGIWVGDHQIREVLDVVRRADHHTFQLLTKNAPRLLQFAQEFPENLWVGVSLPPTYMHGKRLTEDQQRRMFARSLEVLGELAVPVKWVSFEPLSWDVADDVARNPAINWAVIGAATNGSKTYQPNRRWVERLLSVLDAYRIPVFFKGNLEWSSWREDFPRRSETQLSLF